MIQKFQCGKQRTFRISEFEDAELQILLDDNPTQMLEKLSKVLNITPITGVSKCEKSHQ